MATWTLENAKNKLSEVVRSAISDGPQVVTRGGRDAVVVVAKADYEKLLAPEGLVSFMRSSPLADAAEKGELSDRAFGSRHEAGLDARL